MLYFIADLYLVNFVVNLCFIFENLQFKLIFATKTKTSKL